jgi:hypothetical protein
LKERASLLGYTHIAGLVKVVRGCIKFDKQSMKIDNSSFEKVEEFTYLGIILTNQNSIQEEIKSRLKSGNACCHLAQNLFIF